MKLKLTLIDFRCQGCGKLAWCEEKSLLCLQCKSIQLYIETRKMAKVDPFLVLVKSKFQEIGATIREKLAEFNAASKFGD